jgi:hypothetical protein
MTTRLARLDRGWSLTRTGNIFTVISNSLQGHFHVVYKKLQGSMELTGKTYETWNQLGFLSAIPMKEEDHVNLLLHI